MVLFVSIFSCYKQAILPRMGLILFYYDWQIRKALNLIKKFYTFEQFGAFKVYGYFKYGLFFIWDENETL